MTHGPIWSMAQGLETADLHPVLTASLARKHLSRVIHITNSSMLSWCFGGGKYFLEMLFISKKKKKKLHSNYM